MRLIGVAELIGNLRPGGAGVAAHILDGVPETNDPPVYFGAEADLVCKNALSFRTPTGQAAKCGRSPSVRIAGSVESVAVKFIC